MSQQDWDELPEPEFDAQIRSFKKSINYELIGKAIEIIVQTNAEELKIIKAIINIAIK